MTNYQHNIDDIIKLIEQILSMSVLRRFICKCIQYILLVYASNDKNLNIDLDKITDKYNLLYSQEIKDFIFKIRRELKKSSLYIRW